jgi:hypothetical protein
VGIVSAKTYGTGIKTKNTVPVLKQKIRYRYSNKDTVPVFKQKYGTSIKTKDMVPVLEQKNTAPVFKTKKRYQDQNRYQNQNSTGWYGT